MSLPLDRKPFLPEIIYDRGGDGLLVPVSRSDSPELWERLTETDDAVITKADAAGIFPESSASAPSIVEAMIDALGVYPGMRVLEIGTGTGFNAACLAALGGDVTTVEIDPEIADHARRVLASLGFDRVNVVTGDGASGVPGSAPYDRVIATAAVHTVPYPWVEQCRSGGIIVCPYTGTGHKGGMLVLHVHDGVARGAFQETASFIPLRGQGLSQAEIRSIVTQPHLTVHVGPDGQRLSDTSETPGV